MCTRRRIEYDGVGNVDSGIVKEKWTMDNQMYGTLKVLVKLPNRYRNGKTIRMQLLPSDNEIVTMK